MAVRSRSPRRLIAGILLAAALASSAATVPALAADFLPGVQDLPLMPGLTVTPDATTVFDTPAGRIVEAEARSSRGSEAEVRRFYGETLPSLGWRAVDEKTYEREGEKLSITVARRGGGVSVRFDIRPR